MTLTMILTDTIVPILLVSIVILAIFPYCFVLRIALDVIQSSSKARKNR